KSEIRNKSKSELANRTAVSVFCFEFGICFEFRISSFGFCVKLTAARRPATMNEEPPRRTAVPVLMELRRIIINEIHEQHIVLLHEVDGERAFPIVIGTFEALSIDRRIKGVQWPRPMTHDLLVGIIDNLGGDL